MNELFFETIKCNDYEIFNLLYHKKRIANTIGSNFNLEEYIYPPNNQLLKCKLIYDSNGIVNVEYSPYRKKAIASFKIITDELITYNKKNIDRSYIEVLSQNKGLCDEIIIVKKGLITDTSIANIAIYYQDKWMTPKNPLLLGTTRDRYLQSGLLTPQDISIDMLKAAKKIALLNAMIDFDIIEHFRIEE